MGVILCDFGEIWGWRYWRDYPSRHTQLCQLADYSSFILRYSFVIRSFILRERWKAVGDGWFFRIGCLLIGVGISLFFRRKE